MSVMGKVEISRVDYEQEATRLNGEKCQGPQIAKLVPKNQREEMDDTIPGPCPVGP